MNRLLFSFFLLSVLTPAAALAQITFGAEFTMTSDALHRAPLLYPTTDDDISTKYGRETLEAFSKRVQQKCPDCRVTSTLDRYELPIYKVTLPNEFSFLVTLDPAVIEIVPDAGTTQEFKKLEPLLESLVFETGKSLGQAPQTSLGGGHVHIGIESAFRGNPVLFRNFFVDWLNHPDLMNSFTGSKYNSPTFYDLPPKLEQEMRKVIAEFDDLLSKEGFLENAAKDPRRGNELIVELARQIQNRVYIETVIETWTPKVKYQALNVTRLADEKVPWHQKTIELRFFAGQKSVNEFLELIQLFEGRLEHLEKSFHGKSAKGALVTYEPLKTYKVEETLSRMAVYTKEAGSHNELIRESVQSEAIKSRISQSGVMRCSRILTQPGSTVTAPNKNARGSLLRRF